MEKVTLIELDSNYLKTFSIETNALQLKKLNLGRLREKSQDISLDYSMFKNNIIDLAKFEKSIIPSIINHIKYCLSLNPITTIFICTGNYSRASNSQEITLLIQKTLDKYSPKKKIPVKILTDKEKAFYGFTSFLNTTKKIYTSSFDFYKGPNSLFDEVFFFTYKSIHINLSNESSVITLFKGQDFSNTHSIDIGLNSVYVFFKGKEVISAESLKEKLRILESQIRNKLKELKLETKNIDICIASGISEIIEGFEYKQKRVPEDSRGYIDFIYDGGFYFKNESDVLVKTIKSLRKNNLKTQALQMERLSKSAGKFISYVIADYFGIRNICMNHGNYRIGLMYHILEK